MAHTEYLRRNLVVAKAVGAKAGVSKALKRLEQQTRPPKWLVDTLRGVLERQDSIPIELAAWRNAAPDAPEKIDSERGSEAMNDRAAAVTENPDLQFTPEECPVCFSTDLHSASLNNEAAVSCCDCDWIATYAYLRATESEGG